MSPSAIQRAVFDSRKECLIFSIEYWICEFFKSAKCSIIQNYRDTFFYCRQVLKMAQGFGKIGCIGFFLFLSKTGKIFIKHHQH